MRALIAVDPSAAVAGTGTVWLSRPMELPGGVFMRSPFASARSAGVPHSSSVPELRATRTGSLLERRPDQRPARAGPCAEAKDGLLRPPAQLRGSLAVALALQQAQPQPLAFVPRHRQGHLDPRQLVALH